jgi:hypothetical protein
MVISHVHLTPLGGNKTYTGYYSMVQWSFHMSISQCNQYGLRDVPTGEGIRPILATTPAALASTGNHFCHSSLFPLR